jgi:hypothetical protein
MATIDPLRRAWSIGFLCRTAASGPPRPIVLWGAWLLLGFTALASLVVALELLLQARSDVVPGVLLLALAAFLGNILARMTARYVRAKRECDGPSAPTHTDEHSAE